MSNSVYLVLTKQPGGVSDEEFNRWYDLHVDEILGSPGMLSAQRFALSPVLGAPGDFSHLALYEYEGDLEQWRSDVRARVESEEIVYPSWFPQVELASWDCQPRGGRRG